MAGESCGLQGQVYGLFESMRNKLGETIFMTGFIIQEQTKIHLTKMYLSLLSENTPILISGDESLSFVCKTVLLGTNVL
jgi:hypothetical protein